MDQNLIHKVLRVALDDVRDCIDQHALVAGRYSVWIVVDASGRAKASFRELPAKNPAGTRCMRDAFEAQRFPSPWEATVAYSGNSPPQRTYSVAYPFIVARPHTELIGADLPPWRPAPARAGMLPRRR
jgi:hypothetical protein